MIPKATSPVAPFLARGTPERNGDVGRRAIDHRARARAVVEGVERLRETRLRTPDVVARHDLDRGVDGAGDRLDDDRSQAGLRTLLEPALPRLDALPRSESRVLRVALELAPGAAPEPFRVAFAVLSLLGAAAVDEPVALVADDVHRLDRCTANVLCLVARRLRPTDAVVVFHAGRAGRSAVLTGAGINRLKLGTFDARAPWPGVAAPPAPAPRHEHAHEHRYARPRAARPFPY